MAAPGEVNTWDEPARRLVAVLRELGAAVGADYRDNLVWHSPDADAEAWADSDVVHKLMERSRTPEEGARGLVHGHLGDRGKPPIVDLLWRAGADGRVLDCTARFNPRGGARSLIRHESQWLVSLLGRVVEVAGGNAGRIVTSSWLAEDDRRMRNGVPASGMVPFWLGEVTFLPVAVDQASLPVTLRAHPWSTGRGAGTVVSLTDLAASIVAPTQAIDDMLTLRRHLPDS